MPDSGGAPSPRKPISMHASGAMTPQNHPLDFLKTPFEKSRLDHCSKNAFIVFAALFAVMESQPDRTAQNEPPHSTVHPRRPPVGETAVLRPFQPLSRWLLLLLSRLLRHDGGYPTLTLRRNLARTVGQFRKSGLLVRLEAHGPSTVQAANVDPSPQEAPPFACDQWINNEPEFINQPGIDKARLRAGNMLARDG